MESNAAAEIVNTEEKNSCGLTQSEVYRLKTEYTCSLKGYKLKNEEKLRAIRDEKSDLRGIYNAVMGFYTLSPEPLHKANMNENAYIITAKQTRNLDFVYFFMHFYEKKLNGRISELIDHGTDFLTRAEQIIEIKSQCREYILKKFLYFDETKGAGFTTYIYEGMGRAILGALAAREDYGFTSVDDYAAFRRMARLIYDENIFGSTAHRRFSGAVCTYAEERGCSPEKSLSIAKAVIDHTCRVSEYIYSDEDGERTDIFQQIADPCTDSRNKKEFIPGDIPSGEVYKAFKKLSYRQQRIIEKRLAVCFKCGRVRDPAEKESFDDIANDFELKSPKAAEKIYRTAITKLTGILIENNLIDGAEIELASRKGYGNSVKSAVYRFRPCYPGKPCEWGTIEFDFVTGTAQVEKPFLFDAYETEVIKYIRSLPPSSLPKSATVPFI